MAAPGDADELGPCGGRVNGARGGQRADRIVGAVDAQHRVGNGAEIRQLRPARGRARTAPPCAGRPRTAGRGAPGTRSRYRVPPPAGPAGPGGRRRQPRQHQASAAGTWPVAARPAANRAPVSDPARTRGPGSPGRQQVRYLRRDQPGVLRGVRHDVHPVPVTGDPAAEARVERRVLAAAGDEDERAPGSDTVGLAPAGGHDRLADDGHPRPFPIIPAKIIGKTARRPPPISSPVLRPE